MTALHWASNVLALGAVAVIVWTVWVFVTDPRRAER